MEYKYWIVPPLLIVIILIIYYYKTNKTNNKQIESNEPIIKFITSENQDKQLQLLITSMIKYIQKQETTSKYLVDSINKSSLFNKLAKYCYSCKDRNHLTSECPLISYKPNKLVLIRNYI